MSVQAVAGYIATINSDASRQAVAGYIATINSDASRQAVAGYIATSLDYSWIWEIIMAVLDEVSQWESVNKLQDGEEVEAFHLNQGPQNLTNRTRWLYDMISQSGMKRACRCATTANITLSGTQVIDGVSVVAGDSVLVKNQNSQYENGIYVAAAGTWSRRFDADSTLDLNGANVPVGGGTVNGHTIWMQQTAEPVVGTSDIVFGKVYPVNLSHTHTNDSTIGGPYALASEIVNYSLPPATILALASATPPTGWLECDGTAISRSAYAALFAVIGTTYGSGNGSSTFNLPDLRGEFIRGWDHGKGTDAGRALGTSQSDGLKSHNHNDGVHTNLIRPPYAGSLTGNDYAGGGTEQAVGPNDSAPILATGGSETRPRNISMMYIIKT